MNGKTMSNTGIYKSAAIAVITLFVSAVATFVLAMFISSPVNADQLKPIISVRINSQGQKIVQGHDLVPACMTPDAAHDFARKSGHKIDPTLKIYCDGELMFDGATLNDRVL